MGSNGYDYKAIKALASDLGVTISELLALAPNNDPFYCGTPREISMAAWFMDVWTGAGFTEGVHLRRVHYRLVSNPEAVKADGMPYENTDNDWKYLCNAGKFARYLGLIDPFAFEDRRNPDPHIRGGALPYDHEPGVDFDAWDDWHLPRIYSDLGANLNLRLPGSPNLEGYDFEGVLDQPYHLEVWVEKTTLESDIRPACERLGITYLAGPGFQSITRVVGMIRRVKRFEKPAVIFYISDFDPAGDIMPVAVARQIEFWAKRLDVGVNVKLQPIALTRDQVVTYNLPRIPIKTSDLRRQGFEDRRGEGAVELDALEALHPGEIAEILTEAAKPYRDSELESRLWDAQWDARRMVNREWAEAIQEHQNELDQLQPKIEAIYNKYRDRLAAIGQELNQELDPIMDELVNVRQAISLEMDYFDPDLPDRPEPETDHPDGWIMFDTARGYLDQMDAYKRFKQPSP